MGEERKEGVFLGYLHPDEVSASFVESLENLKQWDQQNSQHLRQWGKVRAGALGIPEGRNQLAEQVLASDCEWLFMVDADMGFAPDILDRLLDSADRNDRPIVGGLAFAFREYSTDGMGGFRRMALPTIFDYQVLPDGKPRFVGRKHYPVGQMVPAKGTGAACLLVHRDVLQAVFDKYGATWFDRIMGADGLMGEDISFCARFGSLGFPLWINTAARTTHHKALWLAEEDFWLDYGVPPATEEVDVIVPTVKPRVHLLAELAETLRASTGLARLVYVVDDEEHAGMVPDWGDVIIEPGSFAHKINHAYGRLESTRPWIKVVGDDCRFRPAWLDHAQHVAHLYDAKVVGSNDLANPRVLDGQHATHWMISREYIDTAGASWDGPGVVAHEGYAHNFVDDEIVTVAKTRGVFQVALGSLVEHYHPIAGKREHDEVDDRNDATLNKDRLLFQARFKKHYAR